MNDGPHTEDLDLKTVKTREDLAVMLRILHARADSPTLRQLSEWSVQHGKPALAKTTVSEMLNAQRLTKKTVLLAFVEACGVPLGELTPWRHAWERAAGKEKGRASLDTELANLREEALRRAQTEAGELVELAEQKAEEILAAAQEAAGKLSPTSRSRS